MKHGQGLFPYPCVRGKERFSITFFIEERTHALLGAENHWRQDGAICSVLTRFLRMVYDGSRLLPSRHVGRMADLGHCLENVLAIGVA